MWFPNESGNTVRLLMRPLIPNFTDSGILSVVSYEWWTYNSIHSMEVNVPTRLVGIREFEAWKKSLFFCLFHFLLLFLGRRCVF